MNKFLTPLAAAVLIASSPIALADDSDTLPKVNKKSMYHVYIGALYGQPDQNRAQTEYGYGFTAAVGIPLHFLSNRLHLELGGNDITWKTDKALASNFIRRSLTADLQYAFGDRDKLTPFILAGVGVARNDVSPDTLDKTTFMANIGAGLTGMLPGNVVRGRIDVRGIYDDYQRQHGLLDAIITAGIEMPLGRIRTETVERQVEVIREVPKEIIKELEIAPLDTDGDGIPDVRDDCPDTLPGVRTDNRGCALAQTLTLENIEFDFNKATLRPSTESILEATTKFLNSQSNLRAVVAGHTDNIGGGAYNQRLSEARAKTVVQALVTRGIAADRLKAIGLGDSFPRTGNDTQEGRDRNRRVELLLSAADQPTTVGSDQSANQATGE